MKLRLIIYTLCVYIIMQACRLACMFVYILDGFMYCMWVCGSLLCDFHDCSEELSQPHSYYHYTTTPVGLVIMSTHKINKDCGENKNDDDERTTHRNQTIYRIINK